MENNLEEFVIKNKRLPVYILTGFLGSGKTTLLQKLLAWCQQEGRRVGLLVNDFGAVNVDSMLVGMAGQRNGLTLRELSGGCACCTVSKNFQVDILEMTLTYELDLIIIEASGIADPLDLLDQLTAPGLLKRVQPAGIVSVVDAQRLMSTGTLMQLVRRQIEFADLLVLNKCDLISEDEYDKALNRLAAANPAAQIMPTMYAEIDPAIVFDRNASGLMNEDGFVHNDEHDHLPFHTFEYTFAGPVERAALETFFARLPETVLRAKGFVYLQNENRPFLFQYVPGTVVLTPLDPEDVVTPAAVFIGLQMDKTALLSDLNQLLI